MARLLSPILIGVVLLQACASSSSGPGPDASAGEAAAPGGSKCTTSWQVAKGGGGSARIAGGALELGGPYTTGTVAGVEQMGLTGALEVTVRFESFMPPGAGAFVQARLTTLEADSKVEALARLKQGEGLKAQLKSLDGFPEGRTTATAATAGEFRFTRPMGPGSDTLTVSATAGPDSARNTALFFHQPLRLSIEVGTEGAASTSGNVAVKITEVVVSGGGGQVRSDSFECDSLP